MRLSEISLRRFRYKGLSTSLNIDPHQLSDLLCDLYAATSDATVRAVLADRLAASFAARSCMLQVSDLDSSEVIAVSVTENVLAKWPAYAQHYGTMDEWYIRARHRLGEAVLGVDLVAEKTLMQTEWYNDYLRPSEIHHAVGAEFAVEPGLIAAVAIHRPADAAPFEADDRAKLALVLPHLTQALRLMRRMEANERGLRGGFNALASLSVGIVVVGPGNRVRSLNEAAERLAQSASGMRIHNGRLELSDPRLDERLRAAVKAASLAPFGHSLSAGETIVVPAGEGQSFTLRVGPLPPDPSAAVEPLAVIFVGVPAPAPRSWSEHIRAVYNLTPAESRLVFALLNGSRLAEYASDTGVSIHTAQSQIKSVFAKTGCRRQSDLMRKMLVDPMLRLA
ncbi:MAG TPA: helix-turn-helix transcriptional regulator [Rhizomicrobium sp.]|nr:helix-turn-helix transcriptional regulator [Rhizomicrobium sp.]